MEAPHTCKDNSPHRNPSHHSESDCHQDCDSSHNPDLGFAGHALSLDIALQIILIQLRPDKPIMQPLGAFSKAKRRQKLNMLVSKLHYK